MGGKEKWGRGWCSRSARGCFPQIGSRSDCTCERRIQGDSSVKHLAVGTNFSRELQYLIKNIYLLSPTVTKHSWVGKGQNFFSISPEKKSPWLNTILHRRTAKQVNKTSNVTFVAKALVTLFAFFNYDFYEFMHHLKLSKNEFGYTNFTCLEKQFLHMASV